MIYVREAARREAARRKRLGLFLAAIIALMLAMVLWGNRAVAGIGPNGFAQYARQGIVNENCRIYGGCSRSPWKVVCTDHPNYATMTDTITCVVRLA